MLCFTVDLFFFYRIVSKDGGNLFLASFCTEALELSSLTKPSQSPVGTLASTQNGHSSPVLTRSPVLIMLPRKVV